MLTLACILLPVLPHCYQPALPGAVAATWFCGGCGAHSLAADAASAAAGLPAQATQTRHELLFVLTVCVVEVCGLLASGALPPPPAVLALQSLCVPRTWCILLVPFASSFACVACGSSLLQTWPCLSQSSLAERAVIHTGNPVHTRAGFGRAGFGSLVIPRPTACTSSCCLVCFWLANELPGPSHASQHFLSVPTVLGGSHLLRL